MGDLPQRERLTAYIQDRYAVQPEYLWAQYPDYAVFRHPASGKWFAVLMSVPQNRLGLAGQEPVPVLNVKCGPLLTGSLLAQEGFLPAYHMNKTHWVSVLLEGPLSDHHILPLLEWSYDSAAPGKRGPKRGKGGPGHG